MLCAESQICSHTVKGVGSLGAAVELDILEEHTAVIYMVLAAALQPLVGGEQIQRRKHCIILFVCIPCGKRKSRPMLFIYVCHGIFPRFLYIR